MDEDRLIKVNGENDVLEFLEKLFANRSELIFFQNKEDGESQSLSLIKNINHHTLDFAIRPTQKFDALDFDQEKPIFIYNESMSIKFSSTIRGKCRDNLAFINIPSELTVKYTRQGQRFSFEEHGLEVIYSNFSQHTYNRRHLVTTGELCDVSANGISFKVSTSAMKNFHQGDKIIFSSINGYSLSQKLSGRVVYMQFFNSIENETYLKLGIKFDRKIPIEQLLRYLENQQYISNSEEIA
jgi:hypothetical protein